ncbi:hypothetical protein MINTM005_12900 [Mycobacterium intracellulare]|nr:hypothetical protein MINTM005_12900 [Mycobacterium intracellulare]
MITHTEWGIRYDKHPKDVVLGRECNPDGTVTQTMVVRDEASARRVLESPAPIGALRKRIVHRQVTDWIEEKE